MCLVAVDQCRERRRLPRPGRAREQHDPALLVGDRVDHRRQQQLLTGADRERDRPAHDRDRSPLAKGVDPEAGEARDGNREVDLALALELLDLARMGEHRSEDRLGRLGPERLRAGNRLERPLHPDDRPRGDLEVQIRALDLDHASEGLLEVEHVSSIGRRGGGLERDPRWIGA
jgi:hypothetical protein